MKAFLGTLVIVGALAGVRPAAATSDCVWYSVKAPVAGTKSGQQCSPVPPLYPQWVTEHNCSALPPAGVSECVTVTIHTP